ncbi:MAG: hypothetical protein ACRD2A_00985 [Vicinamibacterales bacterium]
MQTGETQPIEQHSPFWRLARELLGEADRVLIQAHFPAPWRPAYPTRGSAPDALSLPKTVHNGDGNDVDAAETAQWVIDVLIALDPYVPSLRQYRSRAALAGPADKQGQTSRSN